MNYLKYSNPLFRVFILILILTNCNVQQAIKTTENSCECEGILLPNGKDIDLYDLPQGKAIASIKNDSSSENYFLLSIKKIENEWSQVIAKSPHDSGKQGWINTIYLGVYTSNYSEPLNLYEAPLKTSKIKYTIDAWIPNAWSIQNCNGRWLYVTIVDKNRKYEGWLEPEMQCANPYTTCN